jgi:hypothetical protein
VLSRIEEKSDIILSNIKIVKSEFIDNRYYVAIKYINLPLAQRVALEIKDYNLKIKTSKDYYLNKTDLMDNLKNEFGFYPKVRIYQNNIIINNQFFALLNRNIIDLFKRVDSKNIFFTSNKKIYKNNQLMKFQIITKKEGFISVLYVEETGKVGIILNNIKIVKEIIYPNKNEEEDLIAFNPSEEMISEFYIALYSQDRLDLNKFEEISCNLLNNNSYNFSDLIKILNKNIDNFSTLILKIKD